MDRIADEESGVVRAVADDSTTHHAVQMESGVTEDQLKRRHAILMLTLTLTLTLTLVGEGDLSTTELQLRLDLERLKYKVLEQELMLVRQQVWSHPRHEFNAEAENVKALDYKQSVNHVHAEVRLPPAYKEDIKSRNDAAQDNEDKEGVDPEESDNTTMTQNITSAAEVGNDRGIAENILRRAVKIAKAAPSQRSETLRILSTHAHTAALASAIDTMRLVWKFHQVMYQVPKKLSQLPMSSSRHVMTKSHAFTLEV